MCQLAVSRYVVRTARDLLSKGCSRSLVAACIRRQMFPILTITMGTHKSQIQSRYTGGLTGSRVAGQLGRVPVLGTLIDIREGGEV